MRADNLAGPAPSAALNGVAGSQVEHANVRSDNGLREHAERAHPLPFTP